MMPSSITFLAIPSLKTTLVAGADQLHQRLNKQRERFCNRSKDRSRSRIARVNGNAAPATPANAVLLKISRLLRPLFRVRRSDALLRGFTAATRLLLDLKAMAARSKALAVIGRVVRSLLKRFRLLVPSKLRTSLSLLANAKQRRLRKLHQLFQCLVIAAALASRVRRNRQRRLLAPLVALEFVGMMIEKVKNTVTMCIIEHRAMKKKSVAAATIKRAWSGFRSRQCDRLRRKQSLLKLLSSGQNHLHTAEAHHCLVQRVAAQEATRATIAVAGELTQRRAAGLIQRVWRGSRARTHVNALLSAKKQNAYRRRQRDRVRLARAVLLRSSSQESVDKHCVAMRVAARQGKTLLTKNSPAPRQCMARTRGSLHEPIIQHSPPRFSVVTGARVLPMSVGKFEKIRSHRARVNPMNVWVAVPVAFTQLSPSSSQMRATFDWVPASLLLVNSCQQRDLHLCPSVLRDDNDAR